MGARSSEENRAFSRLQQMSMTALRRLADENGVEWQDASRKALMRDLVSCAKVVDVLGAVDSQDVVHI